MTQARFTLDPYTVRVLDVVKGKYGLKSRQQALRRFVQEHGKKYVEPEYDEEFLQEMNEIIEKHYKKYGHKAMTDKELNELLGLQ